MDDGFRKSSSKLVSLPDKDGVVFVFGHDEDVAFEDVDRFRRPDRRSAAAAPTRRSRSEDVDGVVEQCIRGPKQLSLKTKNVSQVVVFFCFFFLMICVF